MTDFKSQRADSRQAAGLLSPRAAGDLPDNRAAGRAKCLTGYGRERYRFYLLLPAATTCCRLRQSVAGCDNRRQTVAGREFWREPVSFFVQRDFQGRGVRIELRP